MKIALSGTEGPMAHGFIRDLLESAALEQPLLGDMDLGEMTTTPESLDDECLETVDLDIIDPESTATTSIMVQMPACHEISRPGLFTWEHRLGRRGVRVQSIMREDLN